ncbi:U5 small nuclear ribonucleoprotein 40 kDa protein [Thelohanellus kitauei]|uniref:U5 small nuclear ribonucleoprotein 40 kDa protein n=1 Tax=Thelohanellus kitauei TaxID=669202 RepID=A0A0C2MXV9_THEKT|nr:U5 small nuclear ribonucleoprotein 40 kDa protein [Thelohanellus kitauei]
MIYTWRRFKEDVNRKEWKYQSIDEETRNILMLDHFNSGSRSNLLIILTNNAIVWAFSNTTTYQGELYTLRFHPSGQTLVSAGHDRNILIWNTYGDCENIATLRGHKGAVMEISFSFDGEHFLTASVDKSVGLWDFESGVRIRNFKGHTNYVNACSYSRHLAQLGVSASDDGSLKVWDMRSKQLAHTLDNRFPIFTCCFNSFGDCVISAGIDNEIKVWDLRSLKVNLVLRGHHDSVTGIRLSKDGAYLISNGSDNSGLFGLMSSYVGHISLLHGGTIIYPQDLVTRKFLFYFRCVYVWDCVTRSLVYKLPGHEGSVNDVDFHPIEPIIASCSSDKNIYLGELHI